MIGYRTAIDVEGKSNLKPDDSAKYIVKAFSLFSSGLYKQTEVVEILREEGFSKITKQQLNKILKNPIYAGIMKHGVIEEPVRGKYTPLVTEAVFNAVQDILDGKQPVVAKRQRINPAYPLRNFVKCYYCSRPLTGSSPKGRSKHYSYYHCYTQGCGFRNISTEKMERGFIEILDSMKPSEEMTKLFMRIVKEVYDFKQKEQQSRRRELEREIEELKQRKQKIVDKAIDDILDKETYLEQKELIEKQTRIVGARLEKLSSQLMNNLDECLDYCGYFFTNITELWVGGDIDLKQRFQYILFPNGIYYDGDEFIGTEEKSCIFQLLEAGTRRTSTLAPREGLEPPT